MLICKIVPSLLVIWLGHFCGLYGTLKLYVAYNPDKYWLVNFSEEIINVLETTMKQYYNDT